MPRSVAPELKDCIESLLRDGDRSLSAKELAEIIGEVAQSLTVDLSPLSDNSPSEVEPAGDSAMDGACSAGLAALSEFGAVEQEGSPLAGIGLELDEIRATTQDAAAKYLARAEDIEGIAERPDIDATDAATLAQLATDIYEATAFQDITGQRLTRIAELLRQIEYFAASARAALGDETAAAVADALSDAVEQSETRKTEYILHGPQDAGTANTQDEIDKLLASFD